MLIIALCLMLGGAGSAAAQNMPSYESASAHPRTVLDYFLLCQAIDVNAGGRLELAPSLGSETSLPVRGGRESFERRKNLLREGYSAKDFSVVSVTIDIPNAFIRIAGVQDGLDFALTFVYFDRQGKGNVPAFSYYAAGGDGDVYDTRFYDVDAANRWLEITENVLPGSVGLDYLNGLGDNFDFQGDVYPSVDWEFILPQKGTTVLMIPHMTHEMATSGREGEDYALVKHLAGRKIQLKWNREEGRFLPGGVLR